MLCTVNLCSCAPNGDQHDMGCVGTWVGVVAPAEDTLVGAGKRGRGLHAAVALNAIEGVLVAAAPPAQHALRPTAQLHSAVGSYAATNRT